MKKYIMLTLIICACIFGYKFVYDTPAAKAERPQEEITKCIKQLETLSSESVANCYHINMPESTLEGNVVKDHIGQVWTFTINGKCLPKDDCKLNIARGKKSFDVRLWYEIPEAEK